MNLGNLKKCGFLSLFLILGGLLLADTPALAMDVYVIVDGSSSMKRGGTEAINWLCATLLDRRVRDGDRLWIWTARAKPELVFSGAGADREAAKTVIRALRFQGEAADYRGALSEVKGRLRAGRLSYTLLVSGSGAKDPPQAEAELSGLLRYSRVDSFSGWRVLTVGLDLDGRIDRASSYYMRNMESR
ncbi:MAG: VWA domain-containing protein [Treponema sp.]|jgi:hypothetical protein|nr:VWA domain-containing protein [Treponema sp.]